MNIDRQSYGATPGAIRDQLAQQVAGNNVLGAPPRPAENVVDALNALNRAIGFARTAGWIVEVSLRDEDPRDAQSIGIGYPPIKLNISREV